MGETCVYFPDGLLRIIVCYGITRKPSSVNLSLLCMFEKRRNEANEDVVFARVLKEFESVGIYFCREIKYIHC